MTVLPQADFWPSSIFLTPAEHGQAGAGDALDGVGGLLQFETPIR